MNEFKRLIYKLAEKASETACAFEPAGSEHLYVAGYIEGVRMGIRLAAEGNAEMGKRLEEGE